MHDRSRIFCLTNNYRMGSLTRMCSLSGIIQSECQPAFVCEHAILDAQQICVHALGVAPEVKVLYVCVCVRLRVRACLLMCVGVWECGWAWKEAAGVWALPRFHVPCVYAWVYGMCVCVECTECECMCECSVCVCFVCACVCLCVRVCLA